MNPSAVDPDSPSPVAETDRLIRDIVVTVAGAEGVDPLELAPLYDAVDSDALAALRRSGGTERPVEFTYSGYRIVARANGDVDVIDEADGRDGED